ncbi:hypothetical protein DEU34_2255 [Microbacterium sp. AG1240]|uniref:hypothetical protein n=1 Tax=Microbacterium sp. AG1240 TaxID=2183992 RepID=UPI000EACF746|nr:hypothetical protein [Microbacterium sp. AG1240]RKT33652.1 hypothetical protein DEU34_2255 [Microbacterium sp. AG1240]
MKLRLSLTVSLTRDTPTVESEEAPSVDEKGSALIEKAEPQGVGFAIDPYRSDPFEERRRP